ncbi:hypothetical protein Vretimale_14678 [Volvox reticuliferus]|uniref:Uncharacterized protein n=1 Tax=Volvox reticuliferus TaxID=1737510 RepID=A0A8J4CQ02_9CHLO|nr:hypothetical protein Vretifemale_15676 [Volvox reticuliferus]GIM11142.1 hypothetical protein Vretimale_14678 [Volvox reticuliferus]
MSQRQLFRSACRTLQSALQTSARSSTGNAGSASGLMMRSVAGKMQSGSSSAPCTALLRSFRPTGVQAMAAPTFVPMGFAASAPSVTASLSTLGSLAQHRGVSSTELAEDGDGDEGVATYLPIIMWSIDSQSALKIRPFGEELSDTL